MNATFNIWLFESSTSVYALAIVQSHFILIIKAKMVEMAQAVGPDSRLCIGLAVENHRGLANWPTPLPPPIAKSWDNDTTNAAVVFSHYLTCKAVIYTAHLYEIKAPSKRFIPQQSY